jgi:thioredoxin 1
MSPLVKVAIVVALLGGVGVVVAFKVAADAERTPHPTASPGSSASAQSSAPLPRLISLGAGQCVPCRMMEPIRAELQAEYAGRLRIEYHDVWRDPSAGQHYGIRIIPTLIYLDAHGRELGRTEGYMTKQQILEVFAKLGVDLGRAGGAESGS